MGIKGRRKKLREREARLAQDTEQIDSDVVVMGDGPYKPPVDAFGRLKMKKSELFKLQDQDYLDRVRDEHQNRRQSHMQSRKRDRDEDDEVQEVEDEYLGHAYDTEAAIAALTPGHAPGSQTDVDSQQELLERRRKAGTGAPYRHPLVGLDPVIVTALETEGFRRMTVIQERTIPFAIEGYDLLGQARTGSGKTLAFCVPVLHLTKSIVKKYPKATVALMMAPTKELCVQTRDVLLSVVQHIPASEAAFSVQLITGGTKVLEERKRLSSGANIVVGTPGRIHDHVQHSKTWDLSRLRFLVLDEADRMLADGFQRDLDAIVPQLPKGRQSFLFSATNSKSVHELARLSLARTPIFIDTVGEAPLPIESGGHSAVSATAMAIPAYRQYGGHSDSDSEDTDGENDDDDDDDDDDDVSSAENSAGDDDDAPDDSDEAIPSTLCQFCHVVPFNERLLSLYVFVKRIARVSKAMIFCSTVASTTFHCQIMGSVGFHDDVMMLHGHMKHRQRVQAFQIFREWKTGVLFCTDVAARGLDIPDVEWILQYDPPLDPTEYIHRIGRTARAGNVGNSLLFLAPEEVNFIKYLSKFNIRLEKYPMPPQLPRIQEKLEHVLQLDEVVAKSAVTAYRAHVGAYQSHILKDTFAVGRLNLKELSTSFALTSAPKVTLPRNAAEEKKQEYVKGKLKSLNKRRQDAMKHYEQYKTKKQWDAGNFIGIGKPQ